MHTTKRDLKEIKKSRQAQQNKSKSRFKPRYAIGDHVLCMKIRSTELALKFRSKQFAPRLKCNQGWSSLLLLWATTRLCCNRSARPLQRRAVHLLLLHPTHRLRPHASISLTPTSSVPRRCQYLSHERGEARLAVPVPFARYPTNSCCRSVPGL